MTDPLAALRQGAHNAVFTCMGVTAPDRVFILTDQTRSAIGEALAEAVRSCGAEVSVAQLEDYAVRPILAVPVALHQDLLAFAPSVTFYAAGSQKGEITFRIGLRVILMRDLHVRHAHMIGITEQLMTEGMTADYQQIARLTQQVYDLVRDAHEIRVKSPAGTDLVAQFDPRLRWVPCTGIYHHAGQWGNLPEGETFTCPATAEGVVAANVLGDYFSEKYGVLPTPVFFHITNGEISRVEGENHALVNEVATYLASSENGRRMGEFAIGTNIALTGLTGNLLQDEKLPGVHVAFGDSYPHETGATWSSAIHVDVIPTTCTIELDGRTIMIDGKFIF